MRVRMWTGYPMRNVPREVAGCVIALAVLVCVPVSAETWEASRLITPAAHDTKCLTVYPAAAGGFHFTYCNADNWYIHYMRYTRDGAFSPLRTAFTRNFCHNPRIAEAGSGALWIVFEDWAGDAPNMGATHSYDGGVTWSPAENITGFGSDSGVKFPSIAPFGGPYSHQMVATTVRLHDKRMYYNVWDGFKFTGIKEMPGSRCNSEYWSTGSARAADGSVYRSYGHDNDLYMNVWNGTSWAGETRVTYDNEFFAWPDVAGNDFGLVCFVWERDEKVYASIYTPGHGFGAATQLGNGRLSSVTGIPGRNDFYVTFVELGSHDAILGRRWAAGTWQPAVLVSAGIPRDFSVQNKVCADRWGTVYCVFEYWGADYPQTYFTLCRDFESGATPTPLDTPPTPPPPTITPTFTATVTATVTLTPTVTNTPRSRTPSATPTQGPGIWESLRLW